MFKTIGILLRSKAQTAQPTSPRNSSRSATTNTPGLPPWSSIRSLKQHFDLTVPTPHLLKLPLKFMQGHLGIAIAQTHASGVFPTPDRPIKNKPLCFKCLSSRHERPQSYADRISRDAQIDFAAAILLYLSSNVIGYSAIGSWLQEPAAKKAESKSWQS